jgi:hypothetical protein
MNSLWRVLQKSALIMNKIIALKIWVFSWCGNIPKGINDDKNVKMTKIVKILILSSSFSVTIL